MPSLTSWWIQPNDKFYNVPPWNLCHLQWVQLPTPPLPPFLNPLVGNPDFLVTCQDIKLNMWMKRKDSHSMPVSVPCEQNIWRFTLFFIYLDDVLVASQSRKLHPEHLCVVLSGTQDYSCWYCTPGTSH